MRRLVPIVIDWLQEVSDGRASGNLTVDEAETLEARDMREHRDANQRNADRIMSFLFGWSCAINLAKDAYRSEVLALLSDTDRDQFLDIEPQLAHCITKTYAAERATQPILHTGSLSRRE